MSRPRRLTTWCRLLRLPNLFTVPGDPLAGFLLATGGVPAWRAVGGIAVSFLIYAAGLLLNDYFDREVDARERPERPIPSGVARAGTVLGVGLILLVGGVAIAFAMGGPVPGLVASALALAVLAYDGWLKSVKGVGQVVMGSCRAGSVLVGAAFAGKVGAPPALAVAGIAWAYITAVTFLAAREMGPERPRLGAFVPGAILIAGVAVILSGWRPEAPAEAFLPVALLGMGTGSTVWGAIWVVRGKMAVPPFVGALIRALIPVQAAWAIWPCSMGAEAYWLVGLGSIAWWKCAEFASGKFYGS